MTVRELTRFVNLSTTRRSTSKIRGSASNGARCNPGFDDIHLEHRPISSRLVQQSLVILIQHHCVLHSSHALESTNVSQDDYYETNNDEILARLRFGTYEAIATGWNDSIAEQIIHALLLHGQILAGDLLDSIATQQEHDMTDQIRPGTSKPVDKYRAMKVSSTLVRLLQDSYVRPSTAMQHVSRRDREIAHEAALRKSFKGIPTAKTLREFKMKVAHLIDEEDSRESEAPDQATNDTRLGLKRKATTASPQAKRSRKDYHIDGSVGSQDDSVMWDVDRNVWLRVNYDRFNVQIRNDIIVRAVSQKFNATTGELFRAILANDRPGTLRCELDERSNPVSINTIVQSLPAGFKLQRGLDKRSLLDNSADSQPTVPELIADYIAILAGQDNISSTVQSTRFLAAFGSTTTTSASGIAKVPTTVTIEYGNILRSLQLQLVNDVVNLRFGAMAGRIFKILLEKGKLEEKHVSSITHQDIQNRTAFHGRDTRLMCPYVCRIFIESPRSPQKQRTQPAAHFLSMVCGFQEV